MPMTAPAFGAEISIFDSKVDPKLSWVLVEDCLVPVLKAKMQDICYVLKKVDSTCNLKLDMKDCQ